MLQRLLLPIFAIMILTSSIAQAAQICVVLDTPASSFAAPEKVYKAVQDSLDKMFANSRSEIMPISETDAYVQLYREQHGQAYDSDNGVITSTGKRYLSLNPEDLVNIANHFNSDYLIYIRVTSSAPDTTYGFLTVGKKVNVILDFRVWSTAKNDFVYLNRYITSGSSNAFYIGSGSSSKAVDDALNKGLKQVQEDSKIINEKIAVEARS